MAVEPLADRVKQYGSPSTRTYEAIHITPTFSRAATAMIGKSKSARERTGTNTTESWMPPKQVRADAD
jgi:hypothetical protein